MKGHDYVLLSSLYYDRKKEYEELYNTRMHSKECVHLDFSIGENPAFFMETPGLLRIVVEITRLDKEIAKLANRLPGIALQQYIDKCLIDEIVITNNIEGVHSTRKEIGEILDDLEGKSNKRFFGLVNKYVALLTGSDLFVSNSRDVRSLYDDMFLKEILEEDPEDIPDGEIFRKNPVDVVNAAQKVIHHGLYPESKIISSMEKALAVLNNDDIEPLFRISVFHYLFGYIHPFYDGNGRLNRFLSSYYLANTLESVVAYRLSYTIKENIGTYYKGFKIVNDEKNKGDMTPFLFMYLDFVRESAENLKDDLAKKVQALENYSKILKNLPYGSDEKYHQLYYFLLQATLFSEIGIPTRDLLEYLSISRPTLTKRLKELEAGNLLITAGRGNNKYYRLNTETLKDFDK